VFWLKVPQLELLCGVATYVLFIRFCQGHFCKNTVSAQHNLLWKFGCSSDIGLNSEGEFK
jgi:hypothetical protein